MSEAVNFWMENKNCVGKTAAVIGDQSLVCYRDRYYVLQGGVAQTRGGKPLRFSRTSLPANWKLALKGEAELPAELPTASDPVPGPIPYKRQRKAAEKPAMTEQKQESAAGKSAMEPGPIMKSLKKGEAKVSSQPPVVANCPYCNARHEIPLEKGKSGKPFFVPCVKCSNEFAVRLVPVTVYQAQVAGFR
ncbi:MAG TPA: hypothetical protein VN652_01100 [Geobacteraceae bacterium]|nr:hypothetical protein [Geobacteraceae bacterium]